MARRFGRDSSAAGWSRYLAVTAALVFGLLVALGVAGSDGPVCQRVQRQRGECDQRTRVAERKTGLEPWVAHRLITFRAGWLELEAA